MAYDPASLDTRANSSEGVWFTLTDLNGDDIIDGGKPVQIKLYGKDSAVAKSVIDAIEANEKPEKALALLVAEWSDNLEVESAESLVSIPHVADWVYKHATSRANFTMKA